MSLFTFCQLFVYSWAAFCLLYTEFVYISDEDEEEIDEDRRMREAYGLVRTQKHFGGLLNDIKRKKPFYLSDFFNGLHPQCLSSFLFLYFACLAPIVTFGGLLGQATENRIATIESLVSGENEFALKSLINVNLNIANKSVRLFLFKILNDSLYQM